MTGIEEGYGAYWLDQGVTAHDSREAATKLIEMLTDYLKNPDLHYVEWQFEDWSVEESDQ